MIFNAISEVGTDEHAVAVIQHSLIREGVCGTAFFDLVGVFYVGPSAPVVRGWSNLIARVQHIVISHRYLYATSSSGTHRRFLPVCGPLQHRMNSLWLLLFLQSVRICQSVSRRPAVRTNIELEFDGVREYGCVSLKWATGRLPDIKNSSTSGVRWHIASTPHWNVRVEMTRPAPVTSCSVFVCLLVFLARRPRKQSTGNPTERGYFSCDYQQTFSLNYSTIMIQDKQSPARASLLTLSILNCIQWFKLSTGSARVVQNSLSFKYWVPALLQSARNSIGSLCAMHPSLSPLSLYNSQEMLFTGEFQSKWDSKFSNKIQPPDLQFVHDDSAEYAVLHCRSVSSE